MQVICGLPANQSNLDIAQQKLVRRTFANYQRWRRRAATDFTPGAGSDETMRSRFARKHKSDGGGSVVQNNDLRTKSAGTLLFAAAAAGRAKQGGVKK